MKQRTDKQNRSLHLYFQKMSELLNDGGFTVKVVLSKTPELDWNEKLFKEMLWRRVQRKKTGKKSSKDLDSGEIQIVWEELNRFIGQEFGLHCPWPSIESLVEEEENMKKYSYPEHEGEVKF